MKSEIRKFFIDKIYPAVETKDIVVTEERLIRYHKALDYYLDLAEKNECHCFDSFEDILKELEKNQHQNRMFIRHGFRPISK